jgi:GT2 family glycosyltransferase
MTLGEAWPRVRVVILNYNKPSLTLTTVRSILMQRYEPLDLVVVDNGSSEEEYRTLSQELGACRVHLVRVSRNLGYAAGNNAGIRYSGLPAPEYVLIVNNDVTLPQPDILSKLVTAIETRKPSCVAASPLVNTLASGLPVTEQIQVRRVPNYLTLLVAGSWWLRRIPGFKQKVASHIYNDLPPYTTERWIECETINGSCFLIAAHFLNEIGLLDEGTFLYQEEIILGKQMLTRGRRAVLVTSTLVDHEQGATSGHHKNSVRFSAMRAMASSEAYYCVEYLGTPRALVLALLAVRYFDAGTKLAYQRLAQIWSS